MFSLWIRTERKREAASSYKDTNPTISFNFISLENPSPNVIKLGVSSSIYALHETKHFVFNNVSTEKRAAEKVSIQDNKSKG